MKLAINFYLLTGVRNGQKTKKLPSPDTIFLEKVYPRVSNNVKMKIFQSYQKEEIHKASYFKAKANFSMINIFLFFSLAICHLHNKLDRNETFSFYHF